MAVNSHLVDCGTGFVVVDAQLCVSDARAVRAAVEATGKPLLAVLLTHPHPDHYAGAAVLTKGLDVPFVATHAVAAVVARDDAEKERVVAPMVGTEWPIERRFPDRVVEGGAVLTFGDVTFVVTDWGRGESHADSIWAIGHETLCVGVLVYNGEHAYLADAHGETWLQGLTRLEGLLSPTSVLHLGHGRSGGAELVAPQRRYVETFLRAVGVALDLTPDVRKQHVLAAVRPLASNESLLFLAELSIEPVAQVLRHAVAGAGPVEQEPA